MSVYVRISVSLTLCVKCVLYAEIIVTSENLNVYVLIDTLQVVRGYSFSECTAASSADKCVRRCNKSYREIVLFSSFSQSDCGNIINSGDTSSCSKMAI